MITICKIKLQRKKRIFSQETINFSILSIIIMDSFGLEDEPPERFRYIFVKVDFQGDRNFAQSLHFC